MGLLQDPILSLEQASWYLENTHLEKFPGAFELAAGNLCRQTLEQVLFILCFFSKMPKEYYLKKNRTLHVIGYLFDKLNKQEGTSGKTYWEIARNRGHRIRKFAQHPRTLNKWRHILNEPSHFSTKFRKVENSTLKSFINLARSWFDEKDKYLIVGALNEIFSSGRIYATLDNDEENTPGICRQIVVNASNLEKTSDGGLNFKGPKDKFTVLSSTEIPRGRWPTGPVIVQHSVGISIGFQFLNKRHQPINLTSMQSVLESFSSSVGEKRYLSRCLKRLGFQIKWEKR